MACLWWGLLAAAADAPSTGSGWQHFSGVTSLGGYKDNVLLSSQLPDASAFVGVGVELIAWRPVGTAGELQAFVVGEHRQYLSAADLDHEQTLIAEGRYKWSPGPNWSVVAPVEYIYVDQVLDVSATEAVVEATRVRGHLVGARPALQRHSGPGTLELELSGFRELYAAPLDDLWETGGRLTWQHQVATRTRADIFYDLEHDWYDEEPARASDGTPRPGTRRRTLQHEVGLKLRHEWGPDQCWRQTMTLSGRYAKDIGSEYFDYLRPAAVVALRYRRGGWVFEAGARFQHYDYLNQTVSTTDDERRRRSEVMFELRGEREIVSWLKAFAEYGHERTFANRDFEEYSVNTITGGVEASF